MAAKYKGETQEGIREGKGKLTWPGNNYYEGEFHNGLRHGQVSVFVAFIFVLIVGI